MQINFPDESLPDPLEFEKFPEVNQDGSQWTGSEIDYAIKIIYKNLHKLDSYLSSVVSPIARLFLMLCTVLVSS